MVEEVRGHTLWQRWRHLAIVGLILFICAAPLWLAHVLMHRAMSKSWGTNAKGILIKPVSVSKCDAWRGDTLIHLNALPRRWHLVYMTRACCDASCQKTLFHLNQIRRVIRHAWDHTNVVLVRPKQCQKPLPSNIKPTVLAMTPSQVHSWEQLLPKNLQSTDASSQVYLIDPSGYLMMAYTDKDPSMKVLSDLKHVLWVTRGDRSD